VKEKTIRLTFILAEGEFEDGTNTKIIEGLATEVQVSKVGLPEKNTAKIKVSNMSLKDMEKLTFLAFRPLQKRKNKILVEAGEKGETLHQVFKGDITSAFPDFNSAPDVPFEVEAMTAGWSFQRADTPTSVDGETDAGELIRQFAQEAGFGFVNNGVSATVTNGYYQGSAIQKAKQVADEIHRELVCDDDTLTLQDWNASSGEAVLLNPECGLLGYPSFTNDGVKCVSLYNPKLKYGGQIKIESIVPKASGYWKITRLEHSISAYSTSQSWMSDIEGIWLKEAEGKEDPKLE
jgi:hypothetical protein